MEAVPGRIPVAAMLVGWVLTVLYKFQYVVQTIVHFVELVVQIHLQ